MIYWVFLIAGITSTAGGSLVENTFFRVFLFTLGGIWIFSGILGVFGTVLYKKAPTLVATVKVLSKLSEQNVDGLGAVTTTKNTCI